MFWSIILVDFNVEQNGRKKNLPFSVSNPWTVSLSLSLILPVVLPLFFSFLFFILFLIFFIFGPNVKCLLINTEDVIK